MTSDPIQQAEAIHDNLETGMVIMCVVLLAVVIISTAILCNLAGKVRSMNERLRKIETTPGLQQLIALHHIGQNGKH